MKEAGDDHPEYLELRAGVIRLRRYAGEREFRGTPISGEELRGRLDTILHPKPGTARDPLEQLLADARKSEARAWQAAVGSVRGELAKIAEDAPGEIAARLIAVVETLDLLKRDGAIPGKASEGG
jgi:hypothetical protein